MATPADWQRYLTLRALGWAPTAAAAEVGMAKSTALAFERGDPHSSGRRYLERRKQGLALVAEARLDA